ncbi:hypothetical protein BH10PSE14_BH10PSE14_04630 [soil metagenome]
MIGRGFARAAVGAAIFCTGLALGFTLRARFGAAVASAAVAAILTLAAVVWLTWRHDR